jgi:uncharacterized protein
VIREVRSFPLASSTVDAEGRTVTGYASVYGAPSRLLSDSRGRKFRERIRQGSFDRSLAGGADVVFLYNHFRSALLGRTASGTLRLFGDSTGLGFSLRMPETTLARDLAELMRRGDLREMSFAGVVVRDSWSKAEDSIPERSVDEWALEDVSLVTRAAYPAAYANLRTADGLELLEIAKRRFALSSRGSHNGHAHRIA